MKAMTREEFYKKYGAVEVAFSSYYKYTFCYSATLPNGRRLAVKYGGNSEEIYRHSIVAGDAEEVGVLQPCAGTVYEGEKIIEGFYDY